MGEKAQPFVHCPRLDGGDIKIALVIKFRNGVCNGIVETAIEGSELVGVDRSLDSNARSVIA